MIQKVSMTTFCIVASKNRNSHLPGFVLSVRDPVFDFLNQRLIDIRLTNDVKIIVAIKKSPCYNRQEWKTADTLSHIRLPTKNTTGSCHSR